MIMLSFMSLSIDLIMSDKKGSVFEHLPNNGAFFCKVVSNPSLHREVVLKPVR